MVKKKNCIPNNCRFHIFNNARQPENIPLGVNIPDEEIYARPTQDSRQPRGWLVDLINSFGNLGGFRILLERFQSGENLSVAVMYALIRPFGLCYELLTVHTIVKYLMPVVVSKKVLTLSDPCTKFYHKIIKIFRKSHFKFLTV